MKHHLLSVDEYLPESVRNDALVKRSLESIDELIERIDMVTRKQRRVGVMLNNLHGSSSVPAVPAGLQSHVQQKLVRIFIRHEFFASSASSRLDPSPSHVAAATARPYFMVYVDCAVLDPDFERETKYCNLGAHFDKISLQIDKKFSQGESQLLECRREDFPPGTTTHCYRLKVNCHRPNEILLPCKILIHRSSNVCKRYNISDQLRRVILPNIRTDPTEREVLLALWQYVTTHGLLSTDKRYIRCDDALKEVLCNSPSIAAQQQTGGPSSSALVPVSSLRARLAPHLISAPPIVVDHILNAANTAESFERLVSGNYALCGGGRLSTADLYSRAG